MKCLRLFALALAAVAALFSPMAAAQKPPIKIGIGIAQTGPLAGGGKAALLALQMWRDDVNAKGGLLGRQVELIAYDDQSTPATTPGSTPSCSTSTRSICSSLRTGRCRPPRSCRS